MRFLSILLILCHLQLVVETVVASPQQKQYDMTITVVKQNTLIADEGGKHGIIIGSIYDIRQNGVSIGRAVVRVVRETMCGLKLTEMNPGYIPKIGDKLIPVNTLTVEESDILTEMQQTEFRPCSKSITLFHQRQLLFPKDTMRLELHQSFSGFSPPLLFRFPDCF